MASLLDNFQNNLDCQFYRLETHNNHQILVFDSSEEAVFRSR